MRFDGTSCDQLPAICTRDGLPNPFNLMLVCLQVSIPEVGKHFDRLTMRRQDPLPLAKNKILLPVN